MMPPNENILSVSGSYMDSMSRLFLHNKISSLKATNFQEAIDKIFGIIYGADFLRIKQKHDQGSDGILHSKTIVAAYAPERYVLADFKSKINGDYKSYEKNWAKTHKEWLVACNVECSASMKKHVESLKSDAKILTTDGLVDLINLQSWSKVNSIFRCLDISEEYLMFDVFNMIIEDMLQDKPLNEHFIPYEKPIYIKEKITINLENEDAQFFLDEYEESLVYFNFLQQVIRSHCPNEISAVRVKIRNSYTILSGAFKDRFNIMTESYCKKAPDDFYVLYVRVVLIYFFEQCLIGKKTHIESVSTHD